MDSLNIVLDSLNHTIILLKDSLQNSLPPENSSFFQWFKDTIPFFVAIVAILGNHWFTKKREKQKRINENKCFFQYFYDTAILVPKNLVKQSELIKKYINDVERKNPKAIIGVVTKSYLTDILETDRSRLFNFLIDHNFTDKGSKSMREILSIAGTTSENLIILQNEVFKFAQDSKEMMIRINQLLFEEINKILSQIKHQYPKNFESNIFFKQVTKLNSGLHQNPEFDSLDIVSLFNLYFKPLGKFIDENENEFQNPLYDALVMVYLEGEGLTKKHKYQVESIIEFLTEISNSIDESKIKVEKALEILDPKKIVK